MLWRFCLFAIEMATGAVLTHALRTCSKNRETYPAAQFQITTPPDTFALQRSGHLGPAPRVGSILRLDAIVPRGTNDVTGLPFLPTRSASHEGLDLALIGF